MVAANAGPLAEYVPIVAAAAGTFIAAFFAYKGKGKDKGDVVTSADASSQIVAATFTERGQMERLTSAMVGVELAVRSSSDCIGKLTKLLEIEAHRREVEAEVRHALRERGISE